jgi:competence protein ComGF
MKNSRLKLQIAVLAIITYMISALVWWAFALIQFQEKQYSNEIEKLNLKKSLAFEKLDNLIALEINKFPNVAYKRTDSSFLFVETEKKVASYIDYNELLINTLDSFKKSIIT